MKKPKIFIACDTTNLNKIKRIIRETQNSKLPFAYKFGLEFLNSKSGRKFVANLKNKITFGDYKLADIPNTCASAIKAIKDGHHGYTRSNGIPQLRESISRKIYSDYKSNYDPANILITPGGKPVIFISALLLGGSDKEIIYAEEENYLSTLEKGLNLINKLFICS